MFCLFGSNSYCEWNEHTIGFVTFVKSNAKALLTLRIKSPLRSAEGTTRDLPANPVLVFARIFTNTAYCTHSQHAFMWTISSLARIFPYATSNNFLVATAFATSFLSSAVMYLWGQLSYTRMVICMCRANTPSIGRQWKRKKYKYSSKEIYIFTYPL